MHAHEEVEAVLHADEQLLAIIDVNVEFALYRLMNVHARRDVHVAVLGHPVGLEGDGNAVPAMGVDLTQTVATDADDALSQDVRFLVQVQMVLIRIVKRPLLNSNDAGRLRHNLLRESLRLRETGQHIYLIIYTGRHETMATHFFLLLVMLVSFGRAAYETAPLWTSLDTSYLYLIELQVGTPIAAYPDAQTSNFLVDLNSNLTFVFPASLEPSIFQVPSVDAFFYYDESATFTFVNETVQSQSNFSTYHLYFQSEIANDVFCISSDFCWQ